jgi:hypothetical protein
MRLIQIAVVVGMWTSIEATAGPRSGGDSGDGGRGGRLAAVSAGIAGATGGGTGTRSGTSSDGRHWTHPCPSDQFRRRVYDSACVRRCAEGELYRASDAVCVRRTVAIVTAPVAELEVDAEPAAARPQGTARVSAYAGAQKVFESDGAIALELAVSDRWFRLGGTLTRLYERQPSGDRLTLTMPSLALGARIDDSRTTRVYLEAGVVGAITRHDPMMDSSITGVLGGVHAEHSLSRHATLIGAAKLMAFEDDVRAASLRAGIRYRHVQASFSILDFNVGPALYGPELGVGF